MRPLSSPTGAAGALPRSVPPESISSLALLMLVSEHRVQKLALSYPQVGASPRLRETRGGGRTCNANMHVQHTHAFKRKGGVVHKFAHSYDTQCTPRPGTETPAALQTGACTRSQRSGGCAHQLLTLHANTYACLPWLGLSCRPISIACCVRTHTHHLRPPQAPHAVCAATVAVLQVLTMAPSDLAARLVLLKELLPSSDVARMVELAPR